MVESMIVDPCPLKSKISLFDSLGSSQLIPSTVVSLKSVTDNK